MLFEFCVYENDYVYDVKCNLGFAEHQTSTILPYRYSCNKANEVAGGKELQCYKILNKISIFYSGRSESRSV